MFRDMLNKIGWLSDTQRGKLSQLHYRGWGRVSKEPLAGIVNDDGERVIDVMWNTNLSFNQVMAKSEFKDRFIEANAAYLNNDQTDLDYVLDHTYTSPQNRFIGSLLNRLFKSITAGHKF